MPRALLPTSQICAMLAAAPPRLVELTAALTTEQLQTAPASDQWSANQVLAHLRACADVWGGRIATILAEDTPTIQAINPRTWIERTDYLAQDFHRSLRAFTTQRRQLMALLEPLAPAQWARMAAVVGAGKRLQHSVHFYGDWLATHERPHLKQIERIVIARSK